MAIAYELLDTLPQRHPHLCQLRGAVVDADGIAAVPPGHYAGGGRCAGRHAPSSRMHMDADWPGLGLGGLVGTVERLLIVHAAFAALIVRHLQPWEDVEVLPLAIIDHKGRVAGRDHRIVNPVGVMDCLDQERSGIARMPDGRIIDVERFVLSRAKLAAEPAIIRPQEQPGRYLIRADLTTAFAATGFPERNVLVTVLASV